MNLIYEASDRLLENIGQVAHLKQTIASMIISWGKPLSGFNTESSCIGTRRDSADYQTTPLLPERLRALSQQKISETMHIGVWSDVSLFDQYGLTQIGGIVFPKGEELAQANFLGFAVHKHEKLLNTPTFVPFGVCAATDYNPCNEPIFEPDKFRLSPEDAQAARIATLAGLIVLLRQQVIEIRHIGKK